MSTSTFECSQRCMSCRCSGIIWVAPTGSNGTTLKSSTSVLHNFVPDQYFLVTHHTHNYTLAPVFDIQSTGLVSLWAGKLTATELEIRRADCQATVFAVSDLTLTGA